MDGNIRDGQCCGAVFAGRLFEWLLACWIIAGGALYSDTLSVVGDDCPGYFVNGDRKKASFLFVISGFLMSIGYGVIGAIPGIMFTAANRIWTAVFILSLLLFVIQIKRLFNRMEKVMCYA